SGKTGFSQIIIDGKPEPVQGIRGIIERNVMRYHLAVNAFFSAQSLPEDHRHEATLTGWFTKNDSYPQLHEMDEEEYLEIKREEWQNQQRLQQALDAKLKLAANP
ncbi:MAG: hypothetical protein OQK69_04875, partial [Gammaproteobacteria bacterium]|nr:hypothetical protein [Gammaproteobacteria bacterium]